MERRAAELMQKRSPPRSCGPSGNTWPRWLSPCAERTSVRTMPCELSCNSFTLAGTIGLVKLGQPQPDSNLSEEANSGSPETMSTRSEEHTSELQSLMRTSYAVFCLKKKNT